MAGQTSGEALAQAAQTLIGVPFRLHGRNREIGLDCVGLVETALRLVGDDIELPRGYALRWRGPVPIDRFASICGFAEVHGEPHAGDILVVQPGPCQVHLAISLIPPCVVHAHAGLRRVVTGPLTADWPILAILRRIEAAGPLNRGKA